MTPSSTTLRPTAQAQVLRWERWSPLDVYKLGCGVFLMLAPFLFHFVHHTGRIDIALSGVALTVLSLAALVLFAEWEEWLQLALGLWLLAAPWALGLLHTHFMHVSIATGVVVTYLAALEILVVRAPSTFE